MPRTSKKYFDKEFKKIIWGDFLENIGKLKTGKELDGFLNKYLSSDEKIILEKRLGIFHLLENGHSYRKISGKIDVTRKTIIFIKRGFKNPPKKTIEKSGLKKEMSLLGDFALKKNSIFPTSYSGKRRWKI